MKGAQFTDNFYKVKFLPTPKTIELCKREQVQQIREARFKKSLKLSHMAATVLDPGTTVMLQHKTAWGGGGL